MKWKESLAIGVAKVDSQHQRLVNMITQLEQALGRGDALQEMGRIIKSVVEYTRYHFKDEEDLMEQIRFSGKTEHKKLHVDLIEEVRRILLALRGGTTMTPADLIDFLRHWVVDHIEKEDVKIGAEMKRFRDKTATGGDRSGGLDRAPTQEMRATLSQLKTLLAKELIQPGDHAAKKADLLERYARRFSPKSAVEITEEYAQLHALAEEGLIEADEVQRFRETLSRRIDLPSILAHEESAEDRFERLRLFLKEGVITQEAYDGCKADLLKRI